uniref:VOC domain-containing protein n=1 Tax=Amphora coffeiformis TaxID=265554 RepID=A0A7S3L3N9_9STRA|mmetsp:Transcript_11282/g.21573  ORF Transcript_11282/g.21573 Transcript_11282/m.21573 type:complete len:404 (+) Transcript_11282:133-1344(+)
MEISSYAISVKGRNWRRNVFTLHLIGILILSNSVTAFTTGRANNKSDSCRSIMQFALASTAEATTGEQEASSVVDTSTMTLLEHVNLNVPSHEFILPFYYEILGLGMDPRKVANLRYQETGKMTLWANCGASQFHLPYGEQAQTIPGHIGLQYADEQSLQALEDRLKANPDAYERCQKSPDARTGKDAIHIVDKYGNQFTCRIGTSRVDGSWKQPIIGTSTGDVEQWGEDVVNRFGRDSCAAACAGIAYVEFFSPRGTAEKIALFYDSVFDATTSVVQDTTGPVAVIAFGRVTAQGLADQALLFRETDEPIPPYDGHHVAMYVGQSAADFDQAYKNAELANVVWVNPRFSDKADTLKGAQKWKQFRFKNIVDMDTGKPIFELEHEIRSVEHEAWPGKQVLGLY